MKAIFLPVLDIINWEEEGAKWRRYTTFDDKIEEYRILYSFNALSKAGISPECIKTIYSMSQGTSIYYYSDKEID